MEREEHQELTEDRLSATKEVSRRDFLKMAGVAGAAVSLGGGLGALLGACGGESTATTAAGAETTTTAAVTTTGGSATTAGPGTTAAPAAQTPEDIEAKYGAKKYALEFHTLQLAILKYWAEGGEAALKALGPGNKQTVYENNVNTAKQTSDAETIAQSGFDACNIIPLDAPMGAVINGALQPAKIYFTTTYNTTPWQTPYELGDYYVGYFTPDDFQAGYMFAKTLFEHLGGQGNVVHLEGLEGAVASVRRTAGVDKALSEYPGIKLLARKPTDWTLVTSQKLMENFLVAYPEIHGAMGQDDDVGLGMYNAIRDAGKEIPVTSTDGVAEVVSAIRDSFYLATWATHSHWQCGYTMVKLFDALNGYKPALEERMMFTGGLVVNKDNASKYYDGLFTGNLPYDWAKMSRVLHPDDWDPQNELIPIDPSTFWSNDKKPAGYNLPAVYGQFDLAGVQKLYADHWKAVKW